MDGRTVASARERSRQTVVTVLRPRARASTRAFRSDRVATAVMAALLVVGAAALVYLTRRWNLFFYDEWGTVFYRRAGGFDAFFAPHNGHLQAAVIAVYRALFATAGLAHYGPYRAAITIAHLLLVALVFAYARRRVQPELAVLLSLVVLLVGQGWEVIFWPINLGFVLPLIAFVAVLLAWERRSDGAAVSAAVLVGGALASSGLGIAVAAGLGAHAAVRRAWKRLFAVALPSALYLAWYLLYRPSALPPAELRHLPGARPNGDVGAAADLPALSAVPRYLAHVVEAAANGAVGRGPAGGPAVPIALAVGAVVALARRPSTRRGVVPVVVALGAFWALIAVARGGAGTPAASRYVYPAVVLMVLAAAELLRGLELPRPALLAAAVATAVVVAVNVHTLSEVDAGAGRSFAIQRAELRALPAAEQPATFRPDPRRMPGVTKGAYAAAVRALGYPPGTRP